MIVGCCIFIGIAIIGVIFPFCGSDKALTRVLIVTAVFCCWLNWFLIYLSQMYPILVPVDERYATFYNNENHTKPPLKYQNNYL
uniref:V-type proton ATPase subunit n=1 Tax=Arcella intermedia TaxID=1963864 RepID=A0A6B2LVH5_9EUKA